MVGRDSPWLKRITAAAPAVWAFATLRAKLQPPRWISAIAAGREAREVVGTTGGSAVSGAPTAASVNAPSQPLVLARGGSQLDVDRDVTWAVTVPECAAGHAAHRVRDGGRRRVLLDRLRDREVEQVDADAPAGRLSVLTT